MQLKKTYKTPEIQSEDIAIGVFGDYGGDSNGCGHGWNDLDWTPLFWITSIFQVWCCN